MTRTVSILLSTILLVSGGIILALNLYGNTRTLRNTQGPFKLSSEQLMTATQRMKEEGDRAWATRMTMLVHNGILHEWTPEKRHEYNIILPVWENWIIYLVKYIQPSFRDYEFISLERAVERGVGLCSQQAIILSKILRQEGLDAGIIALDGHVVNFLNLDRQIILDPDFGIVIDASLEEVRNDPSIIKKTYAAHSPDHLSTIYARPATMCPAGVTDYLPRRSTLEPVLYFLKWAIPLTMILLGTIGLLTKKRK